VFSIISIIVSFFAIGLSLWSIIEHRAMKNSTHRIEWRPVQDPYENKEEDLEAFADDGINAL
jgi:hypothetical protein